jgi:hypothetical protein
MVLECNTADSFPDKNDLKELWGLKEPKIWHVIEEVDRYDILLEELNKCVSLLEERLSMVLMDRDCNVDGEECAVMQKVKLWHTLMSNNDSLEKRIHELRDIHYRINI